MMISVPEAATPQGKLIETPSGWELPTALTVAMSGVVLGNGIVAPFDNGEGNGIGPTLRNCCPAVPVTATGRK